MQGDDVEDTVINSNVETPDDTRDHCNVVFIGHVDAGKSTISGNLLLLTGMVDQRTIEKYEREAKEKKRESWFLAYIMDTNEEERAKGKTVEVGRAYFSTPVRRFTILDAPGHKQYVPNMIGGAAQADIAILVISARKGEFETGFEKGGQTREHVILAKTMGINTLIVVINKMDESTVNWSKERFDYIVNKLTPFLRNNGYNLKTSVIFMPISGFGGHNLKDRSSSCTWYNGPALIEVLEKIKLPKRNAEGPLRIPVLDKYRDAGKIIIQGKVESGTIKESQTVLIFPNKDSGKVNFLGTDLTERKSCGPGENVRISIAGCKFENISPGFVICDEQNPVRPVSQFEAQIYIVNLLDHNPIFSKGYNSVLHVHTATEECTISKLLDYVDPKTGKPMNKKPQYLKIGDCAIVRIKTTQPVCVETFKEFPQLGRFILRDEGITIVIGTILRLPGKKQKASKNN